MSLTRLFDHGGGGVAAREELKLLVKREMEYVGEFSTPIVADVGVGENWRDI